MVSLKAVQASNAGLRALPNITALFVGGTSGIGQSTLRQLARYADSPTAYIVGRDQARASPFLSELHELSPKGRFHFIEADVSLARNVDVACRQILDKEKHLNYLFMTPGGISLGGRNETIEGIDYLFALRYYSRMRFVQNLLPLLEASSGPSRVVSIYGGGFEFSINTSDLDLKHNFSLLNAYKHSITMTSVSMEHLSQTHPKVSFVHAYPGLVGTNIYNNSFPWPISSFYNYALWPFFSVNLQESGERHLFHLSSARYPAKEGITTQGVPVESEMGVVATGTTGEVGSGAYLLNWKGDVSSSNKILAQYREQGVSESVWKHTEELLAEAVRR
ncbi:NAD(P)-binding protein [Aspergillus sclerotiicarbonarius CBS 121057]|uniref:NAD(P)-binding protein n=1 Tax=Aspergillus sclerotiicarbonarius (strain CBS 121057 / IBT 28362) TaxID=1448318 RepID=A0A319DV02_ASPSB|nr:NAD(P)-binding protein [Aspergillus sclerotiicarbonarius CBS 121057]